MIVWVFLLSLSVLVVAVGYRIIRRHRPLERRDAVSAVWLREHRDV